MLHREQSLQQEQQVDVQILQSVQALTEEVGGLRGQVRDFRTVMMGAGDQGETEFGRIPMLERYRQSHEDRLCALEASQARASNTAAVYKNIGHVAAVLFGSLLTLLAEKLFLLLGR
jgi:hypothetical protein